MVLYLPLYQNHYFDAVIENCYEKKVLFESQSLRNTCEGGVASNFGMNHFSEHLQKPTNDHLCCCPYTIIIVVIIFINNTFLIVIIYIFQTWFSYFLITLYIKIYVIVK